ncbi:hypothetical protein ACHQM5_013750 [Ranunculus cassubicifolius]
MKGSFCLCVLFLIILHLHINFLETEARSYYPSGGVEGTKAILTINSFERGGEGGGPSECDGQYHDNDTLVVALSTRWFDHKSRCFKNIQINYNGRSVLAKVVDECDSTRGCRNDIVDASKGVWKALGVPQSQWGWSDITWSDA